MLLMFTFMVLVNTPYTGTTYPIILQKSISMYRGSKIQILSIKQCSLWSYIAPSTRQYMSIKFNTLERTYEHVRFGNGLTSSSAHSSSRQLGMPKHTTIFRHGNIQASYSLPLWYKPLTKLPKLSCSNGVTRQKENSLVHREDKPCIG